MESLRILETLPWCKPNWQYLSTDKETEEFLLHCSKLPTLELTGDIEEVIRKSKEFPLEFPIQTVRLETLKTRRCIERLSNNITTTYPLIHERVLLLMTRFLSYKREFGSDIEKKLYKEMTVDQFIDRLLKKRSATFMKANDHYKLITGETGKGGWETVGTLEEKPPLLLENVLSYDEIKVSAMLYVSGKTECINDGSRKNSGVVNEHEIEENAVIIGLGVWMISNHQTDVYILTFLDRIRAFLLEERLNHVSDIILSYIRPSSSVAALFSETIPPKGKTMQQKLFLENKTHSKGGINVQLENREPAERLRGVHEGKLLVLTYAWDGNAQPGNEFWIGKLSSSGDSAAASSTQVSELHNPLINPAVAAPNTRVAGRNGLQTLQEYCQCTVIT